jgi:hypothetical protein
MAEKTVISIEVDGVQKSITSIKELKAELKAAQSAALNGDGKAAKRVAELKDKMDDLKDTTKSLQGSGVEKISSGFSLLGQGFKDFDFDKIKTGFKGVGAAMSAIPIFLIIEGISYLVQNWKELSEGNGLVAKSLQFLGDIFTSITDVIYEFTDAIGLTNTELDKQGDAIKGFAEKSNAALNEQSQSFDRQIAAAKASGKNTVELEQAKQQAIIDTNYLIAKQIEAFVRAGGELDAEKSKQLTASLDLIKNAKVQEYVITEEDNKAKQEQYKKHLEAKKAADDKAKAELEKSKAESDALFESLSKEQDAKLAAANKEKDDLEVQRAKLRDEMKAQQLALDKQEAEDFIANEAAKAQAEKDRINAGFELANQSLQATQNLTDIFFNYKISKAKKGSKEEEDLARKQFNINKALQIGLATIDGFKAISASLALSPVAIGPAPNPAGIASLAFVAISTAATIAKIASSQFKGGGGGGGGGETPTVGSPSIPSGNGTPSIAAPQQNTTTFTGNNNNNFNQPPIKTYVVETDLRNSTNTIDKIKDQATF